MIQNPDAPRIRINCAQFAALLLYDTDSSISKGVRLSSNACTVKPLFKDTLETEKT